MSRITLTPRDTITLSLDASRLRLDEWVCLSREQIEHFELNSPAGRIPVGDLFRVEMQPNDAMPRLVLAGGTATMHQVGFQHRLGVIHCEGDVGDHAGACMLGGRMIINGNAGNRLAAPVGSRGVGMNGGQLIVHGSVGDDAGARMRRGEIWIAGDAGNRLASWQVAGTIAIGGSIGKHVAYGMRRGTLILKRRLSLDAKRFTRPIEFHSAMTGLLAGRSDLPAEWSAFNGWREQTLCLGDQSIAGRGEIWMPSAPNPSF